jgi:hypothetical protein
VTQGVGPEFKPQYWGGKKVHDQDIRGLCFSFWFCFGRGGVWIFLRQSGQMPVAYAYNPSCSGGRDQEDLSSKLAQKNSS